MRGGDKDSLGHGGSSSRPTLLSPELPVFKKFRDASNHVAEAVGTSDPPNQSADAVEGLSPRIRPGTPSRPAYMVARNPRAKAWPCLAANRSQRTVWGGPAERPRR